MSESIVIVGGGGAAAAVTRAYREAGGAAPLTLVSADVQLPYTRPPLSKGVLRGETEPDRVLVEDAAFYRDRDVTVLLGTRAERVDAKRRLVHLEDGSHLPYTSLVVATGARPRRLPVQGADLAGVHVFRTMADAVAVRDAARHARSAVVVGGSFIGAEVAASLRLVGLEVTVLELGDRLMPALSSPALAEQLAGLYRERGVDLLLGTGLSGFGGEGGRVVAATTDAGDVAADLVVVGVGVQPNVELLEGTGAELDDGVVVDERFRTSLPDVYAVGDVARFPDPVFGRRRRVEHWTSAGAQGAYLGRVLAGRDEAYDHLTVFFTMLFDVKLQVIGDLDGGVDDHALEGSLAEGAVLGWYVRGGRVVGAVVSGQPDEVVERVRATVREQPPAESGAAALGVGTG